MMAEGQHAIIPDSGVAATDPGSRNKKRRWIPAFAGMTK
jgi:hypothetical protein